VITVLGQKGRPISARYSKESRVGTEQFLKVCLTEGVSIARLLKVVFEICQLREEVKSVNHQT
jgi:hypothetical protein